MRFNDISATALAAVALLQGACAQDAPAYGSLTSATTTYTTTLTVMRVVETTTATRSGSTSTYETTEIETSAMTVPVAHSAPTGYIPNYANGTFTSSAVGTAPGSGGGASAPSSSAPVPTNYQGAAGKMGVESLGMAAVAVIVGVLAI